MSKFLDFLARIIITGSIISLSIIFFVTLFSYPEGKIIFGFLTWAALVVWSVVRLVEKSTTNGGRLY